MKPDGIAFYAGAADRALLWILQSPQALHPKPDIRAQKPEPPNQNPNTRNPKALFPFLQCYHALNPTLETRSLKPETRNPKAFRWVLESLQALTSKPEVRNPNPENRLLGPSITSSTDQIRFQNPEFRTLNPGTSENHFEFINPKLETKIQELETQIHKPETQIHKLQTREPKCETLNQALHGGQGGAAACNQIAKRRRAYRFQKSHTLNPKSCILHPKSSVEVCTRLLPDHLSILPPLSFLRSLSRSPYTLHSKPSNTNIKF